jgi:hypothetical protein
MKTLFTRFMIMNQAGDGGAGGGAGAGGAASGAGTPPPTTTNDWTTGLTDEHKGYAQLKGFKDPASVIDSYRNLEKHMGAPKERLMVLPEKADDVEAWKQIHNRLGRPEKPEGYQFKLADEAGGEKLSSFLRNQFHELGITTKQAESLMTKYGEFFTSEVTETNTAMQTELLNQQTALKTQWGSAHDQNINIAKKAAMAFGLDAPTIDKMEAALGYDGVMKHLYAIGSKIGEDKFVAGGNGQGFGGQILTPEAAQVRITELKSDKAFFDKLNAKDQESLNLWNKLHAQAYPSN